MCARVRGWSVPHPGGWTYQTYRFQSWSGMEVNIGAQRESSGLPRALITILYERVVLLRTGCQSVQCAPICTSDDLHGVIQLYVDEIGVCRVPPNWSTVGAYSATE